MCKTGAVVTLVSRSTALHMALILTGRELLLAQRRGFEAASSN